MMMSEISQHTFDIKDPLLGQVLILSPDTDLVSVTTALAGLGLQPDGVETGLDTTPVSVPMTAGFAHNRQTPRVIYSTNPIVDLRLLDVALCPPNLRRRIARALSVIDRVTVGSWAQDKDERTALRGFWAAVETERVDLLRLISARKNDSNTLIASEAARAAERLEDIDAARMSVLGGMGMIAKAAVEMTNAIANPAHFQNLLATMTDLKELFTPEILNGI